MPKSKEFVSSESDSDSDYEAPKKKKTKVEKKEEKVVEKKETKKPAASSGERSFQISKNRFVTVSEFRGKVMVGIREFYEADGELKPGKKGISLPYDQWEKFKKQFDEINEAVNDMR